MSDAAARTFRAAAFSLFVSARIACSGRSLMVAVPLEKFYLRRAFRGPVLGNALLKQVARTAIERDCDRMEWTVLDWNESSIRSYESLGAKPLSD